MSEAPTRVAIIGGGCAAMAAAFDLSSPAQGNKFDITVYQVGWRLGGKGASGRGDAMRIEEHGLHLWMGFYENAFKLMRDTYGELDRDPEQCHIAAWTDAFSPLPFVGIAENRQDGNWGVWEALLPMDNGLPGDPLGEDNPFSVTHYMRRLVGLMRMLLLQYNPNPEDLASLQQVSESQLFTHSQVMALTSVVHAIGLVEDALFKVDARLGNAAFPMLNSIMDNALAQLRQATHDHPTAHRVWALVDLTFATIRGIMADGLLTDPRGFDAISHLDCREWLHKHGASEESLNTGYMRGLYDLIFGYANGDPSRPAADAGQALRGVFRSLFTYRGSFFWKMHAGMGDIVFAPIYEVLKARGVKFEFFHRFTQLHLGDDGSKHISALEFDVQARVKQGEYQPLIDVNGLPCWPSQPLRDQIEDDQLAEGEQRNYEDFADRRRVEYKVLKVSEDFDYVVLGVGLGVIPETCSALVESDSRWRNMVSRVKTIPTQAFQIWMSADMKEMGWTGPPLTLSGFVEPFDTWADMSHLIGEERWEQEVKSIGYFCNVLEESALELDPEDIRELVKQNVITFLQQDVPALWPAALDDNGDFRWETLVSNTENPAHPIDGQFYLANGKHNPSDLYTQSIPGSSAFRISPLDTKYDNLTIAGDWTACGFNVGCVEAAVMSGKLASHALSGYPRLEDIVGYDHP
jgi:uncharacterized protein with NAD-binding domain and iron-sulfur cluster